MSAICGLLRRDGQPLPPNALGAIQRRMAAYGPDGCGAWQNAAVALGHQMLAVAPESRDERQPLRRDGVTLTADIRLDNRGELLTALELPSGVASRTPDSELLLLAYGRWGEDCVDHLIGDFAFAIWDERRRTLLCARDHLGIVPFFYHTRPDVFAFSASLRALLDVDGIPWTLDECAVADQLSSNWGADREATLFTAIRRLKPAHALTIRDGGLRIRRYWAPDLDQQIRLATPGEYVEAYRAHMERAVRDRLRTNHGVGGFLSGGLDSSTICTIAARELALERRPRLLTYSSVLPPDVAAGSDERPLIQAVLDASPHMDGRFITSARKSFVGSVIDSTFDHALPGMGFQTITEIEADATAHGVRVLLDGWGGDQVATAQGSHALSELILANRWLTFGRLVYRRQQRPMPRLRVAAGALRSVAVHQLAARGIIGRSRALIMKSATTFIATGLAERARITERLREGPRFAGRQFRRLREHQWYMLSEREPEATMERWHPVHAAHRISPALPMLDRRLIEFCLSVPAEYQYGRLPRHLVREATRGIVPDVVRLRHDKTVAFVANPLEFVTADPERLQTVLAALSSSPIVRDLIDVNRLTDYFTVRAPASLRAGQPPGPEFNIAQSAFRLGYMLASISGHHSATLLE